MKIFTVSIFLMLSIKGLTQTIEGWSDYNWKPTSAEKANYYFIQEKTDSGWYRRDFYVHTRKIVRRGLYQDSACKKLVGTAIYFYPNGNFSAIEQKEIQANYRLEFHDNGMMLDSGYYINKKQIGTRLRWHSNGYLADSSTRINDSTVSIVYWFDDGQPAAAGYKVNDRLQGKWTYFHHNGKVAAALMYNKDKIVTAIYSNEEGNIQTDTSAVNREATFKKKGIEGWRNYLMNNTAWPPGVKLTNTNQVTVVVQFVIDEEGKVNDVAIFQPFDPVFDKQAIKIIQQSPTWLPAIEHNRKVKAYRRQPITFVQY
jgi:TonB family protein